MAHQGLQQEPCPNCGAANVRWRKRRRRDVVLTWLRRIVDVTLDKLLGGGNSRRPAMVSNLPWEQLDNAVLTEQYTAMRDAYETRAGWTTPVRFWRCPKCRQEGHVFEAPEQMLELRRRSGGVGGQHRRAIRRRGQRHRQRRHGQGLTHASIGPRRRPVLITAHLPSSC